MVLDVLACAGNQTFATMIKANVEIRSNKNDASVNSSNACQADKSILQSRSPRPSSWLPEAIYEENLISSP
jgi:hypothetical protein